MDRVLAQFEEVISVATATPGAAAWMAREAGGSRQVLIKRLPGDVGKTRATQALALRHPRIVPTRRWLRDGDSIYIVRDWVPGRNLRQTLSDLALRAFDRLHARLLPLLDAIDYAHGAGLPHGAVTPENVLTGSEFPEFALLSDFAAEREAIPPTTRQDFYDLCELYKEFLPARPADDEAGAAARARLLRNLTETQQTVQSAEELRYKLDAVARMADLLGFSSEALETDGARIAQGARLVCAVSPPTALVTPGGGASVTLAMDNEGDVPLHIESVTSDVVWLNLPNRFLPVNLEPGAGGDLIWTLSGARLEEGTYNASLIIRSNDGLVTATPPLRAEWPVQVVAVPVIVKSGSPAASAAPVPLAESLPHPQPTSNAGNALGDHPGIACVQEPDPGLVRYGQNGVLHLGVQNIGPTRLRVDKFRVRPSWLVYPGEFKMLWIEPGATQFLGFSIVGGGLAGGDYKAEVTFTTSELSETPLGLKPVWRDMTCEVRVRVVRGGPALPDGLSKTGCAPLLLAFVSTLGLLAAWLLTT